MKLLVLLAVLPALGSCCAQGYDVWMDGRCFRQNINTYVNYYNSLTACNSDSALLPKITSKQDNDQIYRSLSHQFGYTFWLAITCNGQKFVWADGSEATYNNFAASYTCSNATTGRRYYYGNDQLWHESVDGNTFDVNNVVCEGMARSSSTCDSFDQAQSGASSTCFQVQRLPMLWQDAEIICQRNGAHPAIIHDQATNDFIRRTAISAGFTTAVHIGIHKDAAGNFSWIDGSSVDYTNFETGYPRAGAGDCAAMDTAALPGQWANTQCKNVALPFICTKPAFFATNPQPAGCPAKKQYTNGDDIYSPSYPQAPGAGMCDYTLKHSDPSKKVELEISFLEANSCCDSLTVYDGLTGSFVLATITGYHPTPVSIVAYSNAVRLQWNSTSGAHVRGFHAKMK